MKPFDQIIVVDWSAAAKPSPAKPSENAIWIGTAHVASNEVSTSYYRTRADAEAALHRTVTKAVKSGDRLLIGFDFPFGYPVGFASRITGQPGALALWDWMARSISDGPKNDNCRFETAAAINASLPGIGPFWGRPQNLDLPDLPERGSERRGHPFAERRLVESHIPRAQTVWKLFTTGSVGSQTLLGLPALSRLRTEFLGRVAAWPFESVEDAPVILAEVYPSLLAKQVAELIQLSSVPPIKDKLQVRLLAATLARLDRDGNLSSLFNPMAPAETLSEEGWILGVGHEKILQKTAQNVASVIQPSRPKLTPPRLRDDCFAMPQGVSWVPVDEALMRLKTALVPLTAVEQLTTAAAGGRILAADCTAQRSNPPRPNSAVDGYGFAHAATGAGVQRLPLVAGRAAAGQPYSHPVPAGSAIRILTGAILPDGVDTVVLEEDCAVDSTTVAFDGPVKARANTRAAGEDVASGERALGTGQKLRAPDLALLSALGISEVKVYRPLRVGVLSTGDEIIGDPGRQAEPHQIYDANRPMLLALVKNWGCLPVDLGHVRDDPGLISQAFDHGIAKADVILTSGGASAGDEDHVSTLLRNHGALSSWRIAMKPGRPLALALWNGVPVFGLPGNPVAALVCALIFARPALSLMAGSGWVEPLGFNVPAAFSKSKKAGRREYLRARLTPEGHAEVFASEGSGRISGLSWATGLVELPDEAVEITPGLPVRFLPYAGFGITG